MLAPGHIALGLATYAGASYLAGQVPLPELLAAAALGSLLPDIDHPNSQIGRMLPSISRPVAALIGHRGFTHSLLAVALLTAVLALLAWQQVESLTAATVIALITGYLSHLAGDYLTVRGIPLFWPYRRPGGDYHIPYMAFRTGGPTEILLTAALGLLLTALAVY